MDDSAIKSTCSCRGLGFSFQHPHDISQLSVTPVPEDGCPPFTSSGTKHAHDTHKHASNTHTHKSKTF